MKIGIAYFILDSPFQTNYTDFMNNNAYKAIICDLGNVLISFDHTIAVKKILNYTDKKEEDVYKLFFDSPLTALYEEGKISSSEFFIGVKESLGLDIDYDGFLPMWNEIFFETNLNSRMRDFLKNVKGKIKLVMLSNINETHFDFLNKKMSVFGEFDKLILSYEQGHRKPASEIYETALCSVNVSPSAALYIDDRKDLIEAASKLGIKGIVFDGEPAFEKIVREIKE
jgi:glucose-1-phosphatase